MKIKYFFYVLHKNEKKIWDYSMMKNNLETQNGIRVYCLANVRSYFYLYQNEGEKKRIT